MMLPNISRENGRVTLFVDSKPFYILGGEVHNSCASSLAYMECSVWPLLRGLHLNTLAVPVYWELTEPEEGTFDFSLVDGLLQQARREGLRLILLWFGLWKNAESTYVPGWVKRDTGRFFRASLGPNEGPLRSDCLISPCCEAAVEADARAFGMLMRHLRETDREEQTVILVQVENEVGMLGAPRDICPAAQAAFRSAVPETVASRFGKRGSWEEAFGAQASERFSSYCFASAVERIARAGKREYPLPLYVNAWTVQHPGERPGNYPSGGPVAEQWEMWKLCAPSIEFFSPDIYLTDFAAECEKYQREDNALFIPEAHNTVDAASFALYVAGCRNALGFSPFAIDTIRCYEAPVFNGAAVQEAFSLLRTRDNSKAAEYLSSVSGILDALWEIIEPRRGTGTVQSCLCMNQLRDGLEFEKYGILVKYQRQDPSAPRGALLAIQLREERFFLAGINCTAEFLPAAFSRAEIVRLQEYTAQDGKLVPGRVFNGDEIRPSFGEKLTLLLAELHQVDAEPL